MFEFVLFVNSGNTIIMDVSTSFMCVELLETGGNAFCVGIFVLDLLLCSDERFLGLSHFIYLPHLNFKHEKNYIFNTVVRAVWYKR